MSKDIQSKNQVNTNFTSTKSPWTTQQILGGGGGRQHYVHTDLRNGGLNKCTNIFSSFCLLCVSAFSLRPLHIRNTRHHNCDLFAKGKEGHKQVCPCSVCLCVQWHSARRIWFRRLIWRRSQMVNFKPNLRSLYIKRWMRPFFFSTYLPRLLLCDIRRHIILN